MAILLHGTTRSRAEQLVMGGPVPASAEQGAEGFSTCLETGPFPLGTPREYVLRKAALFSDEGGPVILWMDVPDEIVATAVDEFFPLSQGIVQFDPGRGLEELTTAWSTFRKNLIPVEGP